MFVEDGGGSSRLKGEVALDPDPTLKRLRGLLQLVFLIGLDLVLWGWWLLRLVKAFWRGVPPLPGFVIDVFFAGVRAGGVAGPWREVEDGVGPQGSLFLYPFIVFLYFLAFGCCFLATM